MALEEESKEQRVVDAGPIFAKIGQLVLEIDQLRVRLQLAVNELTVAKEDNERLLAELEDIRALNHKPKE